MCVDDAPDVNTYVLFRKRVDKLGENLVGDDSLGKLIGVVCETAEGQSGGLLDRGHVIEQKGSQESHNTYKDSFRLVMLLGNKVALSGRGLKQRHH